MLRFRFSLSCRGCCATSITDIDSLFLVVMLTDTMCSTDVLAPYVSRATGLLTCMFPVPVSCDFYGTPVCHGEPPGLFLCHAYVFSLMPLFRLSWFSLRPLVSRMIS